MPFRFSSLVEQLFQALISGDRAAGGRTAPPLGLCLERVLYPGDPAGSAPEFQDLALLDPPE